MMTSVLGRLRAHANVTTMISQDYNECITEVHVTHERGSYKVGVAVGT